jgi:hypothetical protein
VETVNLSVFGVSRPLLRSGGASSGESADHDS